MTRPTRIRQLTPADARLLLAERAVDELAEERLDPPCWAPFEALHPLREIKAARAAAVTRVEHTRRVAALPDGVLAAMLADGWHPNHRALSRDTSRTTPPSEVAP